MVRAAPRRSGPPIPILAPGRVAGVLLVLLAPFLLAFGPPGITESDSALVSLYPSDLQQMQRVQAPPPLTAEAALIMDAATGKVVFERQAHQRRAMASTTKMMTALVALEKGKITDKVTVPRIPLPQEASMGLLWGDVLTLEDLLWGLLLPSGNDAATVIAFHVGGGSMENFVKLMNQKAADLGLRNTHFMNPHGLDEDDHYSSAYDLAVIARKAMENTVFAKIVGTRTWTIRASRTFYLTNSNFLLRPVNESIGADGIKTGYTDDAGDSIVASASRDGRRVIVVALDTADRTAEAIKLFNYAFSTFQWVELSLPPYLVWSDGNGKPRPIVMKEPRFEYVPKWETRRFIPFLKLDGAGEVQPDKPVGLVSFRNAQSTLPDIPVYVR